MKEKEAWIAFSTFPLIGPARFLLIKDYFGSAKKAWEAPKEKYLEIGLSNSLMGKFENHRRTFDLPSYLLRLKKLNIRTITIEDKSYPERLKKIDYAPFLLYVRGISDLGKMAQKSIAVVGTRKMTSYGQKVTERLVTGLVKSGVTIVSGLALGIDFVAHRIALESGGKTIAVLGNGLDDIYPPKNKKMGEKLVASKRGLLVSEYPLGYPLSPQNFPVRNRIVSGLSLGVLVIEGAEKSGTLTTASAAAVQGRDVFAVPGPVTSPMSKAPNFLIKNGAKLVESADDILESL